MLSWLCLSPESLGACREVGRAIRLRAEHQLWRQVRPAAWSSQPHLSEDLGSLGVVGAIAHPWSLSLEGRQDPFCASNPPLWLVLKLLQQR